jgi:2-succinyl-5-enolpyruvyl-6-hydroxy-3-cyclohexene-1-carboxylate synthase
VTPAARTYLLLRAFFDELARCGLRAACSSPGSRCAPLVLSLAHEQRIRCYSHIDERCSGFFALGLAKAWGLPVAAICTSGTAAAELGPAVIEAHEARVPLLVLTADRPAELRDTGAGQAIDQLKLFGSAVKWFFEVESDGAEQDAGESADAVASRLRWMRTLACRAYWQALEGRPGPVHLNFPLREPLVSDEPLPTDHSGRGDHEPFLRRPRSQLEVAEGQPVLEEFVRRSRRGIVVAGRCEQDRAGRRGSASGGPLGDATASFCAALGWPLLADPLSGARRGGAAVAHYDLLLRHPELLGGASGELTPDLVLRIGDLPTSKPLREWLASLRAVPQIALDPEGAWQDPASVLAASLALDPTRALSALAARPAALGAAEEDWLASWLSADERAAEAILGVLASEPISEPLVARELGVLLPQSATLFVASSMPVRDVETFWPAREDAPRVLCNRGANGIDGTVSSAFGAAAGGSWSGVKEPVALLIGDVAMAHDIGGLLAAPRLGIKLTIVLLNNAGGGIFDFLEVSGAAMGQATSAAGRERATIYTEHIATPPGLDFIHAASLYGLAHERAADVAGFRGALERAFARERSTIVEVRTDRLANVALHQKLAETVGAALMAG